MMMYVVCVNNGLVGWRLQLQSAGWFHEAYMYNVHVHVHVVNKVLQLVRSNSQHKIVSSAAPDLALSSARDQLCTLSLAYYRLGY